MKQIYDPSKDPKKILCVKGDKVKYFNRETALKASWQKSTGWTPQELAPEVKDLATNNFGVTKKFELIEGDSLAKASPKNILFKSPSKEDCEKYITTNKPTE